VAINVTFKNKGDILLVTASGKDESLEEVEEYGMKVLEQGILTNCRKILCNEIDLNITFRQLILTNQQNSYQKMLRKFVKLPLFVILKTFRMQNSGKRSLLTED